MLIKLETVATLPFSTRNPETGSAAAPTSGPLLSVYENGSLAPMGGTDIALVTLDSTGQYAAQVTCTAASGFEVGKQYVIRAAATFGTVSDEAPIGQFEVSAGVHGKVIGSGVPETGAGQPDGLLILGTNSGAVTIEGGASPALTLTTTGGVALQVTNSPAFGSYAITVDGGLTVNSTVNTQAAVRFRSTGASGALGLYIEGQNGVHMRGSDATSGRGMYLTTASIVPAGQWDVEGSITEVTDPTTIWSHVETISNSKTAFEIVCMAAAGAGAGTVDIGGHTPGATRIETFRYPDGTDAYAVTVDEEGERTSVNLNP